MELQKTDLDQLKLRRTNRVDLILCKLDGFIDEAKAFNDSDSEEMLKKVKKELSQKIVNIKSSEKSTNVKWKYIDIDEKDMSKTLMPIMSDLSIALTSINNKYLKQYHKDLKSMLPNMDNVSFEDVCTINSALAILVRTKKINCEKTVKDDVVEFTKDVKACIKYNKTIDEKEHVEQHDGDVDEFIDNALETEDKDIEV